jgi:hypothetical protein
VLRTIPGAKMIGAFFDKIDTHPMMPKKAPRLTLSDMLLRGYVLFPGAASCHVKDNGSRKHQRFDDVLNRYVDAHQVHAIGQ